MKVYSLYCVSGWNTALLLYVDGEAIFSVELGTGPNPPRYYPYVTWKRGYGYSSWSDAAIVIARLQSVLDNDP